MKERQSNIELLRCILMFMVVVLHFVGHNALSPSSNFHFADKNWLSANLLESFSCCAVDCFVLISGYFSIKFSLRKLVALLLPIAFYELCLSLLFYQYYNSISFTPFNYWFVKPYFLLMLISPILNEGLNLLGGVKIVYVCGVMLILSYWSSSPLAENAGKSFPIFIVLYSIGFYLRNFCNLKKSKSFWMYSFFVSSIMIFIHTFALEVLGKYYGCRSLSYNYNGIFVIVAAISLLMYFGSLDIRARFINWVSCSAFFVYIISENQNMYSHPYGIYDILQVQEWQITAWYPFLILLASTGVFVVCICIDKIRVFVFGTVERRIWKYCDNCEKWILNKINQNEHII